MYGESREDTIVVFGNYKIIKKKLKSQIVRNQKKKKKSYVFKFFAKTYMKQLKYEYFQSLPQCFSCIFDMPKQFYLHTNYKSLNI